jgi:predicted DNA-binding transcriptional regulator YafY
VATEWSFLTNHGRALLCIAHDPGVRLREIAETLGITDRSAYAIVNDLTAAGYVLKKRDGRRNRYIIQQHRRLPEPTLRERTVGDVVELLVGEKRRNRTAASKKTTPTARKSPKRPLKSQNRARKSQKRR